MPPRARSGISVVHENGDEVGELCLDSSYEGVTSPRYSLTLARDIVVARVNLLIGIRQAGVSGGEDLPRVDETHEIPAQTTAPDIGARAGGIVGPNRGFGGVVAVSEEAGGVGGVGVEELDLEEGVGGWGEGSGLSGHEGEEGDGAV